jgi:hypothetical protein
MGFQPEDADIVCLCSERLAPALRGEDRSMVAVARTLMRHGRVNSSSFYNVDTHIPTYSATANAGTPAQARWPPTWVLNGVDSHELGMSKSWPS